MQIKQDSLTFQVKRKFSVPFEFLNLRPTREDAQHDTRTIPRPTCSPHKRVMVNKTADSLAKFQADHMFISAVAESKNRASRSWKHAVERNSFLCAKKRGYEDLTRETLRHFESHGFLNPVILQCDTEMSIRDVCRKVAREREARTLLRFEATTNHQSHGFVEAVNGHI